VTASERAIESLESGSGDRVARAQVWALLAIADALNTIAKVLAEVNR
jgi:hypothetical protein